MEYDFLKIFDITNAFIILLYFSWDVNETLEDSPPYIQILYRSLIKTYTEIEDEMAKTGDSYRVQYAIQEVLIHPFIL